MPDSSRRLGMAARLGKRIEAEWRITARLAYYTPGRTDMLPAYLEEASSTPTTIGTHTEMALDN